ncbi:MAG: hypothetical protein AAFX50_20000 [Acidobacteriota bacterium]
MHAVAVLSNHFHLLGSFDTVEQMARFTCHLKTNLSKEIGRLHDWEGPLFAGRYRSVPLSDEPEIQLERLRYILGQGVKEGLVLSPKDWPGVHCARALLDNVPLPGIWVDRTRLYAARQRGEEAKERDFTQETELHLTPLPCLARLSQAKQRAVLSELMDSIEAETLQRHRKNGTVPLGAEAVLQGDPHQKPGKLSNSPKPHFHATRRVFRGMVEAFREFTLAYRLAAERFAAGDLGVEFPENCFPPRPPFVEAFGFTD